MSIGMNRETGLSYDDEGDHIRQSIRDILTTPIGSRVKRRTYGSLIPTLIDQPANGANRLRLMSATVMAIITWEKRVSVQSATIAISIDGKCTVDMFAIRKEGPRSGKAYNLSIPLLLASTFPCSRHLRLSRLSTTRRCCNSARTASSRSPQTWLMSWTWNRSQQSSYSKMHPTTRFCCAPA